MCGCGTSSAAPVRINGELLFSLCSCSLSAECCPPIPALAYALEPHPTSLLAAACTLVAHRADVTSLACMAPLSLLATGSADTNVKLWCLAGSGGAGSGGAGGGDGSGASTQLHPRVIRVAAQTLRGHAAPITRLEFTPDGQLLISGDAAGGLRVWHVAGGEAGRLLHDLTGHHTAAVTGIACHPEERLFVTSSLDRTLRVWDMDAQPGTCIGVHGPEGRREVRAVAFAAAGRALLAAYPDCLRTFTLDPLAHHDTADVQWSKVGRVGWLAGRACASLACMQGREGRPAAAAAAALRGAARRQHQAVPLLASLISHQHVSPGALLLCLSRRWPPSATPMASASAPACSRAMPACTVSTSPSCARLPGRRQPRAPAPHKPVGGAVLCVFLTLLSRWQGRIHRWLAGWRAQKHDTAMLWDASDGLQRETCQA